MSIVVFLGPSLPLAEARTVLEATYLPPCAMGDVYAALKRYRPAAIGIIDGYFERTPAVWHKEILHALSRGTAVFGGASMGALRAAELHSFGMSGVGRIFSDYAAGTLEDDDEVAVIHLSQDAGYRALSEPMVNIRYGLELARDRGIIDAEMHTRLVSAAKSRHYPERSWAALWNDARHSGIDSLRVERLQRFIEERKPDRKAEDARELLNALQTWRQSDARSPPADFNFEPTIFWEHLCSYHVEASTKTDSGEKVTHERLINHLRLMPQNRRLLDRALLNHLVREEAKRLDLAVADDRTALVRFRQERGLQSVKALDEWLAREDVTQQECLELAREEERLRLLHWRYAEQVNAQLQRTLKSEGRFAAVWTEITEKWRTLSEQLHITKPSESDVESLDAVLAWYQKHYGPIHSDLERYIIELGFGSPRQFLSELLAEYLKQQYDRKCAAAISAPMQDATPASVSHEPCGSQHAY